MTLCGIVWIAMCLPETRRLPLEEIEALFGNAQDTMVFTSPAGRGLEGVISGQDKGGTEHIER